MSESPPNPADEEADELEGFLAASIDNSAAAAQPAAESKEAERPEPAAAAKEEEGDDEDEDEEEEEEEDEGGIELVLDSQTPATLHHGRTFNAITLKPTLHSHKQRAHGNSQYNSQQQPQHIQQQQQQYNQSNSPFPSSAHNGSHQPAVSSGPPADHPFRLPYPNESVYSADMDALADKPWKRPGADISDWFNYGFDEETWRVYSQKQLQIRQINRQVKESRGGLAVAAGAQPMQQQQLPPRQQPQQQLMPPHSMLQQQQPPMPPGGGSGMQRPFIPPPFVPSHMSGPPPQMPPHPGMAMNAPHGGPFGAPPPYAMGPMGQMGGPPPGGYYHGAPPPGAPGGGGAGRRGFSAGPPPGMEGAGGGGGGGLAEGADYGKRGREEYNDGRSEQIKRERTG